MAFHLVVFLFSFSTLPSLHFTLSSQNYLQFPNISCLLYVCGPSTFLFFLPGILSPPCLLGELLFTHLKSLLTWYLPLPFTPSVLYPSVLHVSYPPGVICLSLNCFSTAGPDSAWEEWLCFESFSCWWLLLQCVHVGNTLEMSVELKWFMHYVCVFRASEMFWLKEASFESIFDY